MQAFRACASNETRQASGELDSVICMTSYNGLIALVNRCFQTAGSTMHMHHDLACVTMLPMTGPEADTARTLALLLARIEQKLLACRVRRALDEGGTAGRHREVLYMC